MAFYTAHCLYGYFEKNTLVRVDERFNYMQAGMTNDDKLPIYWLVSYESFIIGYDYVNHELVFPDKTHGFSARDIACPDYSRTTAKHVGIFCKRYCPQFTYYDIKRFWHDFYNAYNE